MAAPKKTQTTEDTSLATPPATKAKTKSTIAPGNEISIPQQGKGPIRQPLINETPAPETRAPLTPRKASEKLEQIIVPLALEEFEPETIPKTQAVPQLKQQIQQQAQENTSIQPFQPSREEIAQRAFEIYIERGCQPGHEEQDWLQAERELQNSHRSARSH